jgi:hypothetical protein
MKADGASDGSKVHTTSHYLGTSRRAMDSMAAKGALADVEGDSTNRELPILHEVYWDLRMATHKRLPRRFSHVRSKAPGPIERP